MVPAIQHAIQLLETTLDLLRLNSFKQQDVLPPTGSDMPDQERVAQMHNPEATSLDEFALGDAIHTLRSSETLSLLIGWLKTCCLTENRIFVHSIIGEETMASILMVTYPFHEDSPNLTPALVDLIILVVRMFDEYLLPLHFVRVMKSLFSSTTCFVAGTNINFILPCLPTRHMKSLDVPDNASWLMSGLLALLQHMGKARQSKIIQRVKEEFMRRLCVYSDKR
ncbi:hypothetical protein BGZ65_011750 [Modicella reniformis]|uniref:Uncharacterized protein n=1 Tax=Modicella reniformis TaxID=1440133 RepID=A0A9P6MJK7_9FUNG|nr:hypothetical protein BGZ65_011750 [Modicella reniformis]